MVGGGAAVRQKRGAAGYEVLCSGLKLLDLKQWTIGARPGRQGRVLFFTMGWCKITFFRRILYQRCCIAWNAGRSVAGGVFAGRFRGRFVGAGDAKSAG